MAGTRKVDVLAGKGSFLDRLRKRRQAVEDGDLEGAAAAFKDEPVAEEEMTEEEFDALPERQKRKLRGDS